MVILKSSSNNDTSLFELLVENEGNEIRYGFEIDSDDGGCS